MKRSTHNSYVPNTKITIMNMEDASGISARRSNGITEAPAEAMPTVSITKKEQAEAKRFTEKSTNSTDLLKGGKGARKSDDITATPMRMTVTPNKKQQHERKQDAPNNCEWP